MAIVVADSSLLLEVIVRIEPGSRIHPPSEQSQLLGQQPPPSFEEHAVVPETHRGGFS